MASSLTLKNFQQDYNRLVVRFENAEERRLAAKNLIDDHYSGNSQLRRDCLDWLKSRK